MADPTDTDDDISPGLSLVAPIIIKRVKKTEHAHHGGAWKVAYADFVTAMMAFFLLLWLLNATTQEQKTAISNYFAPESASYSRSGAGGVMGGKSMSEKGASQASSSPMGLVVPLPSPPPRDENNEENEDSLPAESTPFFGAPTDTEEGGPGRGTGSASEAEVARLATAREEAKFDRAEAALYRAVQATPELRGFSDSLLVDRSKEGLRIQIVDQYEVAMFPLGSARMYSHTRKLLKTIVEVVQRLPNKIAVIGHTDATPYRSRFGYSNWELSSDRAHASRRALVALGLPPDRITRVVGRAAREPLIEDNPKDPRNRRISIILLRSTSPLPEASAAQP